MSFWERSRAARPVQLRCALAVSALTLALACLSCGGKGYTTNHNAYVSLPADGSVLLLNITASNGQIALAAKTPSQANFTPTGLALMPSGKFLYAVNSQGDSISLFKVASDGTLSLTGAPMPAGAGANQAAMDALGQYLLVTNNFDNTVSAYSVDSGTGALTEAAGSPYPANTNPTQIQFTHSGEFVYVVNPGIGTVTGFAFCSPTFATEPQCTNANGNLLVSVPNSPVFSGDGAAAMAIDGSDQYLYVTNPSASNPAPNSTTVGNISGFSIDANTGELTPLTGSPYTSSLGVGPSAITVDPSGRFIYATTPGSSDSVWCFEVTAETGELVAVIGSPFSVSAGGQFALFDPNGGHLYIGNEAGTNIAGYTYDQNSGDISSITNSPFSISRVPGNMVVAH